ncbi:Stk1 family PASTA domain-containing Ser/Thr kinase [Frankia sp. QA3]|uniref:Stk1 family PASTA domain-containing Ser/Thr kinase n=1 Tax=Frankia sp. QA3 TaxID=710111 RepID=UPI000269CD3E|nr:PASTA domain-containing protein [Frankia sp. QA3]EIV96539.1 serine/threonine protein kinase [Frankia sp. QA3]
MADPVIGRLLDGRYTAQERLAVGGMATVYVAHDNRLDRLVALKVMHPNLNHDPEFVARFHREAKAVARLNTPRVVSVLDQGSDHTAAGLVNYLVMELVRGRSLRQHLGARGRLPVAEAIEIIEPVMEALAAAHGAGIIHRDIKPENILLGDDGQVKVADFGLARPLGQPTQALTDGVVMGTVGYLAPEQVTLGTADTRSDVYAAGVVLFESLTGQLPHSGATPMSMAYQSVHGDVPAPSTVVDGVPAELDSLVLRATARDPAHRPADGAALLDELHRIGPYLPAQDAYQTGFTGEVERIGLIGPPPEDPTPDYTRPFQPTDYDYDDIDGAGPFARAESGRPGRPSAAGTAEHDPAARPPHAGGVASQPGTGALYRSSATPAQTSTSYLGAGHGRRRAAGSGSRRYAPFAVGSAVVLVLLLGFIATRSLSSDKIEVPLLTNLSKSDAETMLRDAGLKPTYLDPVANPTVLAGHIAQQAPKDGSKVDKGTVITLRLSSGPATVSVPDLRNLTQEQATARLNEVNLTVGGLSNQASDTVQTGHVIGTNPAVNTMLKPKAGVVLVMSSGPETRQMPADVIGKTYDAAKAEIDALGVAGVTVQRAETVTEGATPGNVVGVTPGVGQPIAPNSTVTLTVAASPDDGGLSADGGDGSGVQVTVPKLVGKTYRDAEKILRQRGLKIDRVGLFGSPNDRVAQQAPQPNSKIEKGSTVHVNTEWQWGN